MRRVIGWSIPLVLIVIGLLWPLVFKGGGDQELPADDPVVFSNFKADYRVNADGSLDAVETITAEFPGGRHGLFRCWDDRQPERPIRAAGTRYHVGDDRRCSRAVPNAVGGRQAVPGGQDRRPRRVPQFRHPRLRDPLLDCPVSSTRAAPAQTRDSPNPPATTRRLRRCSSGTSSPGFWNNRMQQADISVTLPGDVTGAQCSVGFGVGAPCRDLTVTGNKVELSASYLGSRTPVTLRAGVDVPTPARDGIAVALHLGSRSSASR